MACDPLCDKLTPHSPCRGPWLTVSKHADRIWNVGAFEEIAICQHKHFNELPKQEEQKKEFGDPFCSVWFTEKSEI